MNSDKSKTIAVILSGCGVYDGSEIHEAVLTLLYIDQKASKYQCFAPDMSQHHVINHLTGEEADEKRNVLTESARICRGDIKPLSALKIGDFDAVILPGGFGAVKNLSDFAFTGVDFRIHVDVMVTIKAFAEADKPVGLICIAPAMAGRIFGKGVYATIGNDENTIATLEQTGIEHKVCEVNHIIVDENHRLVTTPAYMLANSISEAAAGIEKLVDKILEMC